MESVFGAAFTNKVTLNNISDLFEEPLYAHAFARYYFTEEGEQHRNEKGGLAHKYDYDGWKFDYWGKLHAISELAIWACTNQKTMQNQLTKPSQKTKSIQKKARTTKAQMPQKKTLKISKY